MQLNFNSKLNSQPQTGSETTQDSLENFYWEVLSTLFLFLVVCILMA
jgi:hypothetical protein